MRRTFGLLVVLAGLAGPAGCSSSGAGSGPTSSGSASGHGTDSFAAALAYVPGDATTVAYTDWYALGHPDTPESALAFAPTFRKDASTIGDRLGVNIADASWEIDSTSPTAAATLALAPAQLTEFADGLASLGFARTTKGSVTTLTCAKLLDRCGIQSWAFGDFRVDADAGVVTEYDRDAAVPTPSSDLAVRAKTLLAQAGSPVGASLRLGSQACLSTGLRQRNPRPPKSVVDRLDAIVGKFASIGGVLITSDDKANTTERAYVKLPDASTATAELARRAAVLQPLGMGATSAKAVRTDGSVDVYTLSAASGSGLFTATQQDMVGVNVCPTS